MLDIARDNELVFMVFINQVIAGGPHPGKFTPISKEHPEGIRHHPRCVQSCCCLNLVVPALEKNLSRNGPGSVILWLVPCYNG